MDIRKWLKETVQPELASKHSPEPVGFRHVGSATRRRRRMHATSDSSILDPLHRRTNASPTKCDHSTERNANEHIEDEDLQSTYSHSPSITNSPQQYARRPRHKTRLERYEPSHKITGEQRKNAYGANLGESKKSRRKPKQKTVGKSGINPTHDFHAKNVSTDRLTLKPSENMGIFNKGKTSTRIKGHGCGFMVPIEYTTRRAADKFEVPDLVFSEMAFLKKKEDDNEPVARVVASNNKQKRDQAHNKEDEISAFFTSVRPTLADESRKRQVNSDHQSSRISKSYISPNRKRAREREREEISKVHGVVPTVEKQGSTPYLNPSGGLSQGDTSQISWSESHRTLSRTPGIVQVVPTIDVAHSDSTRPSRDTTNIEHLRNSSSVVTRKKPRGTAELLRVQSSAHPMQDDRAKSLSCRTSVSSPRRPNLNNEDQRIVIDNRALSVAALSSLPTFPVIEARPSGDIDTSKNSEASLGSSNGLQMTSIYRQHILPGTLKDAAVHAPISSLDVVLQECIDAVNEHQCIEIPPARDFRRAVRFRPGDEEVRYDGAESSLVAQKHHNMQPSERTLHLSRAPNFAGPSIYELQEQYRDTGDNIDLDPACFEQSYTSDRDDNGLGIESWEGLVMEEPSWHDAMYEAPGRAGERKVDYGNVPVAQIAQLPIVENHIGTSRFWRPNKLY